MTSYSPPSRFLRALHKETNAVSNTRFSSCSRHKPNKNKNSPQHEARHPPCCIRRHAFPRSKGRSNPRTAFPILALSAGIVSPDQRVVAVLQHRLHPSMSRGCWCCRCCCCCCCCYSYYCCYCNAAASCLCSSGPPVETLYRDQKGGSTPPSRRRFR